MAVKDAQKLIRDNYPDNLSYNGIEFFDKIYMNEILEKVGEALDVEGQEAYLGYDPERDVFINAWDTWDEFSDNNRHENNGSWAVVKVTNGVARVLTIEGYAGEKVYNSFGSYKLIHRQFPKIVDIRLD